jgi:hypothetical protein
MEGTMKIEVVVTTITEGKPDQKAIEYTVDDVPTKEEGYLAVNNEGNCIAEFAEWLYWQITEFDPEEE